MYDLDGHLEAAYEDRYTPDYEFEDFDEPEEEWDEGEPFDEDSDEDECEGHVSLAGAHMGMTVYCDGSCRVRRCLAYARKGTGTGTCDRPLDRHGQCDRASDHIDAP